MQAEQHSNNRKDNGKQKRRKYPQNNPRQFPRIPQVEKTYYYQPIMQST
jgi:hypothetical protein